MRKGLRKEMTILGIAGAVTAATLMGAWWVSRNPLSPEELAQRIDEELAHRVNRLLSGPESDKVTDRELWQEIGGVLGLFRLLRQARLMLGLTVELAKAYPGKISKEAGQLAEHYRLLRKGIKICVFEAWGIGLSGNQPHCHGRSFITIYADIANLCDSVLNQIDGDTPVVFP